VKDGWIGATMEVAWRWCSRVYLGTSFAQSRNSDPSAQLSLNFINSAHTLHDSYHLFQELGTNNERIMSETPCSQMMHSLFRNKHNPALVNNGPVSR